MQRLDDIEEFSPKSIIYNGYLQLDEDAVEAQLNRSQADGSHHREAMSENLIMGLPRSRTKKQTRAISKVTDLDLSSLDIDHVKRI